MASKTEALKQLRADIKAGKLPCIYCAGRSPGVQEEHMPPRSMFVGKHRPDGLIFPACAGCNQGSKDVDQIAAWISRFYPPKAVPFAEIKKFNDAIINNYPEIGSSLIFQRTSGSNLVVAYDQYLVRALELFAAKIGFALHFEHTKRIVPAGGGVSAHFFTNYHAFIGAVPAGLPGILPTPSTLWQGKKNVGSQFQYASAGLPDGSETIHMAAFRQAFMVLAFVREGGSFAQPGGPIYLPGSLQIPYPFGLPKLSEPDLKARFARMKTVLPAQKTKP